MNVISADALKKITDEQGLRQFLENAVSGDTCVYEVEDPSRPGQGKVRQTFFAIVGTKVIHVTSVDGRLCAATKDITDILEQYGENK